MKRFTSLLLAMLTMVSLCVPAMAAGSKFQKVYDYTPGQFTDVPAGAWCAANVQTAYEYGIMGGKTAERFDADGSLTTAQTIVMACRMNSQYYGRTIALDEAPDPWYQPYLDYAEKNGIVWQFDNYDTAISRADFAVILHSALPKTALNTISSIETDAIPDVQSSASYADAVYALYRAGVLTGNDTRGTFAPDSSISRGAAAAIISRMVDPSLRKAITLEKNPFEPVPMKELANLTSIQKKCTDAELQAAYDVALEIVKPLAKKSTKEQLQGIAQALRKMFDSGMTYSTNAPHYDDPYGYFVLHTASCAGCTRATGLCLNILGIPYEHVNESQWSHQWCRVNIDGSYWICDAYGLYCGEEPAPYQHPRF